ncbi:DEAD/DEAH box helicase family protein, partial [Candidatus Parcubacteria bacterium]|nr:DEAD/DEAH box helicase family protein [Candidatus Parcubacteria bacterium]
MVKKVKNIILNELPLAKALEGEAQAWADQGWQGVTQTTYELLAYWFNRSEEADEKFHICQQRAIETIIYCHEILGIKTLEEAFERFAPEVLAQSAELLEEADKIPFPKYCLKMATGTGKTWVLAALLVWQYFNAINNEREKQYSSHFVLVAPGHEVLYRLLDMFLGKHDPKTGSKTLKLKRLRNRSPSGIKSVRAKSAFNLSRLPVFG